MDKWEWYQKLQKILENAFIDNLSRDELSTLCRSAEIINESGIWRNWALIDEGRPIHVRSPRLEESMPVLTGRQYGSCIKLERGLTMEVLRLMSVLVNLL